MVEAKSSDLGRFSRIQELTAGQVTLSKDYPGRADFPELSSQELLCTANSPGANDNWPQTLEVKTSKTRNKPRNIFKWAMPKQSLPPSPKRAKWYFFGFQKYFSTYYRIKFKLIKMMEMMIMMMRK